MRWVAGWPQLFVDQLAYHACAATDLGASKVVAVATDPASASLEPVPRQDAPHVHDETCPVDCKRDVAAPGAGGPEHRSYV
jgi:hypothetical protein